MFLQGYYLGMSTKKYIGTCSISSGKCSSNVLKNNNSKSMEMTGIIKVFIEIPRPTRISRIFLTQLPSVSLPPPGSWLQARPRARAVGEGAGEAGGEEEEERERGQEGRPGLLRLLPKGREDKVSLKAAQNSTEVLYFIRLKCSLRSAMENSQEVLYLLWLKQ